MMNYQQLVDYLFSIREEKHASLSDSISSSDVPSLGIKIPVLKKIVQDNYQNDDLILLQFELNKYIEIDLLYFCLALKRAKNLEGQIFFLKRNLKYAKSWMITDIAQQYMKKMSFEEYEELFNEFIKSEYEFARRYAYVVGLKFAKDEKILSLLDKFVLNETYMVMMSEAWLLATIAINYPEEVFAYLSKIDDMTLKRKTISKICDSYRIEKQQKDKFKTLRR